MDFSSLCININKVITAICSNNRPQPIFCQILLNFVAIVNNPDWVRWSDNVGLMPSLHWYCYSFLKRIFNCFADFCYQLWKWEYHDQSSPNHRAQHEHTKECLNSLKDILLSKQPPPGYNDRYYGYAWFSLCLQCQSLE